MKMNKTNTLNRTVTKCTVLAATLTLLNAPSYAGDTALLLSGAENSKAPVATAVETKKHEYPEFWTGFYGGISLGGNFSSVDLDSNHLGFVNPNGKCDVNPSISSFFPGVQFGYLHQLESKVVLGVEADFTYNTENRASVTCPCPTDLTAKDHFTVRNSLQGSLRGRLGYALSHNLLPFISVGVSFADMGIKYSNESGDNYKRNDTQTGWLAGAGLEWGFSERLSVRAEYFYKAYNSLNIRIPSVSGLTDPSGAGHLNINDNTVRVALNYRF
jgi:outer membrane immunogenic protein